MSKELVISAASHERRVAILEEGQLVEIYIEREKEFALVGSIYKGKVTRVLPGMQSAFVDIGLDGDAFLYVSDVFENLEDYDHGQSHGDHAPSEPSYSPESSHVVEALPGETLARASASHDEVVSPESHSDAHSHDASDAESAHEVAAHDEHSAVADEPMPGNEIAEAPRAEAHDDAQPSFEDERQPESNASAPQNFSPQYNPTQNYSSQRSDRGNDRGGQGYGRNDRDRGRGRWGRRGGRHRGGRSQGPGGRNLPPSKYASPQGDSRGNDSRGYDNRSRDNRGHDQRGHDNRGRDRGSYDSRGSQSRGYENRRQEGSRYENPSASSSGASSEEPILLPGESLAKYRGKPPAPAASPAVEMESHEPQADSENVTPRASASVGAPIPATGPAGSGGPRRFRGGLPRWLLADSEAAPVSAEEDSAEAGEAAHDDDTSAADSSRVELSVSPAADSEQLHGDGDLSEDQAAALASEFIEAKQEETAQKVEAGTVIGGAEFDEEEVEDLQAAVDAELDEEEEDEEESEEAEELAGEELSVSDAEAAEESPEIHPLRAAERAELEANAAHETAEHAAAHGELEDAVLESAHEE
jgi:ribonuclease G